jgi:hypothetical protein
MSYGRRIRVRAHRRDPESAIYAVAEPEVEKAIDILKIGLARPNDLGRVTNTLLNALSGCSPVDSSAHNSRISIASAIADHLRESL